VALHPKEAGKFKVSDFLVKWGPETEADVEAKKEQLKGKAGSVFSRLGGVVRNRGNPR